LPAQFFCTCEYLGRAASKSERNEIAGPDLLLENSRDVDEIDSLPCRDDTIDEFSDCYERGASLELFAAVKEDPTWLYAVLFIVAECRTEHVGV